MRIVHVYKDYLPILGGIENHVRTVAEGQAAQGHDVTVLVTNPAGLPARETIAGVQVRRARRLATVASTPLSIDLIFALRALRPDITHLHFPYPIGEIAQLAAGARRPYVITYHSDVVRQQRALAAYRPILLRALRQSRRIIATSQQYVESSPFLSALRHKCCVVPLSVDFERFQGAAPLIAPDGRPTLLFMGRHRYYKGLGDLLRALPHIEEARLVVGGDGPMRQTWQQMAEALDISGRVHFLGDVDDHALPGLYASADVFVLPANSRAEAFGKVLLEAMAAGLPCITTELGTGTSYIVQHEITGLVVLPGRPTEIAAALRRLLYDGALRERMAAEGRRRAKEEFTTERMLAAIDGVYHAALEGERPV